MHQSVYTFIIRDLKLRVMSPGAQDSSALVTFPSGSTAYKRWVKSLFNHLIMHSSEWEEYARWEKYQLLLLNLVISPEAVSAAKKILNTALDFVGTKSSATIHEVITPLKRRGERPTSESALVASKGNQKPTKKKSQRPHNKPPRSCGFCGQNHLLRECPVLKELAPNAPMFHEKRDANKLPGMVLRKPQTLR